MFSPSTIRSRSSSTTMPSTPSLRSQGWTLPKCSPSLSPPTTSASSYFMLLSPPATASLFSSTPSTSSTAYPSWPNRASLSPALEAPTYAPVSAYASCTSSYISDEDLLDLECWDVKAPAQEDETAEEELPIISWSETKQPPVVLGGEERRYGRRQPPKGMVLVDSRRKRSRAGRKNSKN